MDERHHLSNPLSKNSRTYKNVALHKHQQLTFSAHKVFQSNFQTLHFKLLWCASLSYIRAFVITIRSGKQQYAITTF